MSDLLLNENDAWYFNRFKKIRELVWNVIKHHGEIRRERYKDSGCLLYLYRQKKYHCADRKAKVSQAPRAKSKLSWSDSRVIFSDELKFDYRKRVILTKCETLYKGTVEFPERGLGLHGSCRIRMLWVYWWYRERCKVSTNIAKQSTTKHCKVNCW